MTNLRWPALATVLLVGEITAQQPPLGATFTLPFAAPASVGHARLEDSAFVGGAMLYRYEGRRITGLDIYIWPLPEGASTDSLARDSLLRVEVQNFQEAVPLGTQRGWYDDYRVAFESRHPVDLGSDSLPGYVVALVFAQRGQQFASFFYIYAVQGMYFKVRLTIPAENWGSNPALDLPAQFVRAVSPRR